MPVVVVVVAVVVVVVVAAGSSSSGSSGSCCTCSGVVAVAVAGGAASTAVVAACTMRWPTAWGAPPQTSTILPTLMKCWYGLFSFGGALTMSCTYKGSSYLEIPTLHL